LWLKLKNKSPTRIELVEPTFTALVELGGSATVDEIREKVIELLHLTEVKRIRRNEVI